MLKKRLVKKIGETIKDILYGQAEIKITEYVSRERQKMFEEKFCENLENELLQKYGDEIFYDDLCNVILKNNNLEHLVERAIVIDCFEYITIEQWIDQKIQGMELYHKSQIGGALEYILEKAFVTFNQLEENDHKKLKNYIEKDGINTRAEIKKVLNISKEILKKQNELMNGTLEKGISKTIAIDISLGCKNSVKHFLGREEDINNIQKMLNCEEYEKAALWIYAMGGMGKTQLCRKLYLILKEKYKYIGWISYHGDFKQSLVKCIDNVEKEGNLEKDYCKILSYLKTFGRQLILFIDNYDYQDDYLSDIERLPCNIIITSRNKNPDTFDGYELKFMDFSYCKQLFKKFYILEDTMIINEIIHRTGYLTLAIELVAKTGQKQRIGLEEYYAILVEKEFDIRTIVKSNWDNAGEEYNRALSEHFEIVFDLSELKSNAKAMYILKNISILPYLSVQFDEITEWLDLNKEDTFLIDLVDSGWIQETNESEYVMHPIISYTMRKMKPPKVEECIKLIKSVEKNIEINVGNNYLKIYKYLPYAMSVGEYFKKHSTNNEISLLWLYARLAEIYRQNGDYEIAHEWGELTCNQIRECDIDSHEIRILRNSVYNIMAEICLDMRNRDEESKNWALMAILSDEELDDDIRKSTSYHNLACVLIQMGTYGDALEYENKAKELREKHLEKTNIRIVNVYRNLAMIYRRLGEVDKAYDYQKNVIEVLEEVNKDDMYHPDFPVAYGLFSFILRDRGETVLAIEYQKKAIDIREKNNSDDPKLAINYNNLGVFYRDEENYEESKFWQKKAIDHDLKYRGESHPDLIWDYLNYAKIFEKQGDYGQALDNYEISKKISILNNYDTKEIEEKILNIKKFISYCKGKGEERWEIK